MGIKLHLLWGKKSPLLRVHGDQLQICPRLSSAPPPPHCPLPRPCARGDYISQTPLPLTPRLLDQWVTGGRSEDWKALKETMCFPSPLLLKLCCPVGPVPSVQPLPQWSQLLPGVLTIVLSPTKDLWLTASCNSTSSTGEAVCCYC